MPAALRAAVRSSVLVLILILYVPCVAPMSQNARGVSIAFFVRKIAHTSRRIEPGRWGSFPIIVASAECAATFNFGVEKAWKSGPERVLNCGGALLFTQRPPRN